MCHHQTLERNNFHHAISRRAGLLCLLKEISTQKSLETGKRNQYTGTLLSNETKIQMLLFKYDSSFNYAVGSEFEERKRVSLIGTLTTTTIVVDFFFLMASFLVHQKLERDLEQSSSLIFHLGQWKPEKGRHLLKLTQQVISKQKDPSSETELRRYIKGHFKTH